MTFIKGRAGDEVVSLSSIAAELAHKDASIQAQFFDVFIAELLKCCGSHYLMESQLMSINMELETKTKEKLKSLVFEE